MVEIRMTHEQAVVALRAIGAHRVHLDRAADQERGIVRIRLDEELDLANEAAEAVANGIIGLELVGAGAR